jgi:hypothetical protein
MRRRCAFISFVCVLLAALTAPARCSSSSLSTTGAGSPELCSQVHKSCNRCIYARKQKNSTAATTLVCLGCSGGYRLKKALTPADTPTCGKQTLLLCFISTHPCRAVPCLALLCNLLPALLPVDWITPALVVGCFGMVDRRVVFAAQLCCRAALSHSLLPHCHSWQRLSLAGK